MQRSVRPLVVVLVGIVSLTACSSDEQGEASPTIATDVTPDEATTTPSGTTAAIDSTSDATTTTSTTISSTTSTTVAPPVEEPALMPAAYVGWDSEMYADDDVWLCRDGAGNAATGEGGPAGDVCDRNLDATVVEADGSTEILTHEPANDAEVDCFYVYPTTSQDQAANSDFVPGEPEEIRTTLNQFARLGAVCNTYAPVYRQITIPALFDQVESAPDSRDIAYGDVVDAFRHFIANDNGGRPFVLVGHSQGAGILRRLIDEEIDAEPSLRDRMLSAILLGTSVAPDQYDHLAACTTAGETNCIVSYSSYRSTAPPPAGAFFGRTDAGPALCVNPVDPAGGASTSQAFFSIESGVVPFDDRDRSAEITTTYVMYPDMVTVRCVADDTFGYLELSITTAEGPRADDIPGDLTPEWGMHLVDANVAMGDLVDLVAAQAARAG